MTARDWATVLIGVTAFLVVLNWIARAIVLWLKWRVRRAEMRQRGRL